MIVYMITGVQRNLSTRVFQIFTILDWLHNRALYAYDSREHWLKVEWTRAFNALRVNQISRNAQVRLYNMGEHVRGFFVADYFSGEN